MQDAQCGDWVQIHLIILPVGQRAPQIPAETRQVPFEMRVRGFMLDNQAKIGEKVRIKTVVGREFTGILTAVNPRYLFDYGDPQPQLLTIGQELREMLEARTDV